MSHNATSAQDNFACRPSSPILCFVRYVEEKDFKKVDRSLKRTAQLW